MSHRRASGGLEARDETIAAVARRQYGVITRKQLLAAGLGPDAIDLRLKRRWLHRLHRGVYLTGHPAPSPHARAIAAVLACGRDAVLSHVSAAALWQLVRDAVRSRPVDVTVPNRNPGARPGVRLHRSTALDHREIRVRRRIPLTSPARTLLDLAGIVTARELEQALAEAQRRRLANGRELSTLLARHHGRPGTGPLRALLAAVASPALTRSEAEERFLALVRDAGLPPPRTNARLQGYEVDFLWPRERLVVEVDGYRFHSHRAAFESDRRRDARLEAHGYRVMRVTWRQIVSEPQATLVLVAQALAQSDR